MIGLQSSSDQGYSYDNENDRKDKGLTWIFHKFDDFEFVAYMVAFFKTNIMEGPSLYLAKSQLRQFRKRKVIAVSGNTKTDKERMLNKEVKDIFAWGKHLVFQFDAFAVRIHFLLFGTFEAKVNGVSVTGDYKKRARTSRLAFVFPNGGIEMYNCSVRIEENPKLKNSYDFSIDIMSPKWDARKALKNMKMHENEQVADVLLDQSVFAGVGNIIKNEILSNLRIHPKTIIKNIPLRKRKALIEEARAFSLQFLKWRKAFKLRANLKTHRRSTCQHCGRKLIREKTGKRHRWSYYCEHCQRLYE